MQTMQKTERIALNHILVTTDFSRGSTTSLPFAIALARQFGGELCLAHVLEAELPSAQGQSREISHEWKTTQSRLAEFAMPATRAGARCGTVLERGDFWPVIAGLIDNRNVDLVVTASRGRKGLGRMVLGSSAEQIYRHASCPVLTIGPNVHPAQQNDWKPTRILFPTDGSETSLKALPHALALAEENEAEIIFLQLMPQNCPEYRESDEAICRKELRALVPAEAELWCKPEFVVGFESPAMGILHHAQEREVDLIVMGVRRSPETGNPQRMSWPTASHVVAEALCPVLTVRG